MDYELETRPQGAAKMLETECSTPGVGSLSVDDEQSSRSIDKAQLNRRVVLKLDFILLPFLSLFFLVNSLDRSNVGNAETANFTRDAGLQPGDLNTAVACFFAFFVLLQPVGAALGRRVGMRIWVPSCMVLWGLLTALHVWITAKWQLILIRILIGALEAGFYPTTVSYLSLFYTRYEFAKRLGVFYGQYAIAGALGGILSYGIFSRFPPDTAPDTVLDPAIWKPWQFLFLLEGTLTVFIALLGFCWLPDSAETAWFFSADERQLAQQRIIQDRREQQATSPVEEAEGSENNHNSRPESQDEEAEQPSMEESHGLLDDREGPSKRSHVVLTSNLTNAQGLKVEDILDAFTDWKVFYLLFVNVLSAIPAAAFTVFLPIIVQGFGFSSVNANLFTAPPFLAGAIMLWIFTWWSDRKQERMKPILWGLVILISGLTAVVKLPHDQVGLRYTALSVLLSGSFVASPLTIAWFTGNIEEPGKRSIVLGINGWGNLAGVFSSLLFAPKFSPDYRTPFLVTLSLVMASFVGFLIFRALLVFENKRRKTLLSTWDQRSIEAELRKGLGPQKNHLSWLRREIESSVVRHQLSEGRRGEDKLTFVFGL